MIRQLWPLLIGFTIWAVAFVAIYALQALGCAWNWHPVLHRTILASAALLTLAALAAALAIQLPFFKREPSIVQKAGIVLTMTTLPVTLILFAPITFLSLCN